MSRYAGAACRTVTATFSSERYSMLVTMTLKALPHMDVSLVWLRNTPGISTLAPRAAASPFLSVCANASMRQMRMPP